jgi:hypothetical protein
MVFPVLDDLVCCSAENIVFGFCRTNHELEQMPGDIRSLRAISVEGIWAEHSEHSGIRCHSCWISGPTGNYVCSHECFMGPSDHEESGLGFDEFQKNLGILVEGLLRSRGRK